jgi:peptidoglycan/xylan/chitin deacetylase (PgdA/CDA1 family)
VSERPRSPSASWWRQGLRRALAVAVPRSLYLLRGPVTDGSVCLTFDDGPHPEHTPRVLEALKQLGVRATFFVIGRHAERYPDLVRRLSAEGHDVGNHSFSHTEPSQTSARQLFDDVSRSRELLTSLLGRAPRLVRPPKGKLTVAKLWGLWRSRQTVVLWNVDPKDYACRSADEVAAWFTSHPLTGGDLVLLHDNHPHAAAVLPGLIADVRRRGLRFVTVSEWLKRVSEAEASPKDEANLLSRSRST